MLKASFWESPSCSTSAANTSAPGAGEAAADKARPRFPYCPAPLPLTARTQRGDVREVTDAFLLRLTMLSLLQLTAFSRGSHWAASFQQASPEELPVKPLLCQCQQCGHSTPCCASANSVASSAQAALAVGNSPCRNVLSPTAGSQLTLKALKNRDKVSTASGSCTAAAPRRL